MTISSNSERRRGFALLLVLLALLLLSVIGLGMMYSTNMDTAINSNYRDGQRTLYGAMAGLQEARDRIQPSTHNIDPPAGLPAFVNASAVSSAGVVYIVADASVDPTDPANVFFDTELCQERVLGMTGIFGTPCTAGPSVPAGKAWHRPFVDDSVLSSAPWNLMSPLALKWVRITLKGNNMTPAAVDGVGTASTQVCWNGYNQIALPGGYAADCSPLGAVTILTLTNAGAGYSFAPTVTISPPSIGGTQAMAVVGLSNITNKQVTQIDITKGGAGYTTAPVVSFSAGGGTGAAGIAVISAVGAAIDSLVLSPFNPGAGTQCYLTPPIVSISGGSGSGAAASATLNATKSCIYSWQPTGSCGNPWKGKTETGITLSGGGGSGFRGTIRFTSSGNSISSSSIQDSGSGYTSAPLVAGGGSPNPLNASCVVTPNAVPGYFLKSVALTSHGSGYKTAPTVSIGTGNGVGTKPSVSAILGPAGLGQVLSITVTSGGSGYTSPPTVKFTGGGATTSAAATAVLGITRTLTNLILTKPGSRYTAAPTVTIGPPAPGGVQATATALIDHGPNYGQVWLITSLAQTSRGSRTLAQMEVASPVLGYSSAAAVTLAGPSPSIDSMPHSSNFAIHGNDANSCSQTPQSARPAIASYDDPRSPTKPTAAQTIIDSIPLGNGGNYTGGGSAPDVKNGYSSIGETMGTPTALKGLLDAVNAIAAANGTLYGSNPGNINLGTLANTVVDYVAGDLWLNGSNSGYGILVVTGRLTLSGNFHWNGPVLVVGDGLFSASGLGNGKLTGTLFIAKIWDNYESQNLLSRLGSPSMNWNGGGNFGVQFDHCWADNLMETIPFIPPPATRPLKVLSLRILPD